MADIQKQFQAFIEIIKLADEEETLREKREAVLAALDRGLKRDFAKRGQAVPRYTTFNQGSYSLKTGIRPIDNGNDYDIDVGVVFAVDPTTHQRDPGIVKRWVRDALASHTNDIRIKTPCVTVTYVAGYHVDLAVYAHPQLDLDGTLELSWGKENSASVAWQTNNPRALGTQIQARFPQADERKQFKRVLRALKRWRDLTYKHATSHAAPFGIGLTVAGLQHFQPQIDRFNGLQDDRRATELFVRSLLNAFSNQQFSEKDNAYGRRLVVLVPFAPHKDVFARITNLNMGKLEELLKELLGHLVNAGRAEKNNEACREMRKAFGTDFPEGQDHPDDSTKDSAPHNRVVVPSHTSG